MLDIGWSEMLVIAIVLIVVVGPKDLPKMLRTFGKTTSRLRAMAGDFRKQFDEALKEAELDDVKDIVSDARRLNPANELREALNPMRRAADDVRAGLNAAMNPSKAPEVASPDAEAQAMPPAKAGATALPEGMAKPADMSKVNAAQAKQMKDQAQALAARVEAAAKTGADKAAATKAEVAAKSGGDASAPKAAPRSRTKSAAAKPPSKAAAKATAKPTAARKTDGKTK